MGNSQTEITRLPQPNRPKLANRLMLTPIKQVSQSKQQGAVLVIGLLILLGMTQLAVTGMTTSITQETIARNTHDLVQTLNATESIANFAFAQDDWINLALNYYNDQNHSDWKQYAITDADIVGQQLVERFDMNVVLRSREVLPIGGSAGDGASTTRVQLIVEARAEAKSGKGTTNTTTHGWQRMIAADASR